MNHRELGELERRLAALVRIGEVDVVDPGDPGASPPVAPTATVRIGPLTTAPLRWIADAGEDREWKPPTSGQQVVVLSPSGDSAQGIIIGGLYRTSAPAPADDLAVRRVVFRDGTVVEYDTENSVLRVSAAGDVDVSAVGDVTVTAGGTATLAGSAVKLGASAADPVVRQSDLSAALSTILTWANSHTHIAPPTGGQTATGLPALSVNASGSSVVSSE